MSKGGAHERSSHSQSFESLHRRRGVAVDPDLYRDIRDRAALRHLEALHEHPRNDARENRVSALARSAEGYSGANF